MEITFLFMIVNIFCKYIKFPGCRIELFMLRELLHLTSAVCAQNALNLWWERKPSFGILFVCWPSMELER